MCCAWSYIRLFLGQVSYVRDLHCCSLCLNYRATMRSFTEDTWAQKLVTVLQRRDHAGIHGDSHHDWRRTNRHRWQHAPLRWWEEPAARASPGRAPPSAISRHPIGPLDGLHVFTIFMAVDHWPPMGNVRYNSSSWWTCRWRQTNNWEDEQLHTMVRGSWLEIGRMQGTLGKQIAYMARAWYRR
jgi:hypothetical protein